MALVWSIGLNASVNGTAKETVRLQSRKKQIHQHSVHKTSLCRAKTPAVSYTRQLCLNAVTERTAPQGDNRDRLAFNSKEKGRH